MKIKLITLALGLTTTLVLSSVSVTSNNANASDLSKLFDSYTSNLGFHSTDSRSGNSWTGGQFSARWNRPNIDVIDFKPPSINTGCGGLDIFGGAFGLISGDELAQVGRAIAQGASVYFFKLAINSICASCAAEMENIANVLRRFNELSRNACQMTEQALTEKHGAGAEKGLLDDYLVNGSGESASGMLNSWTDQILDPGDNPSSTDGTKAHMEKNMFMAGLKELSSSSDLSFFRTSLGFSAHGSDDTLNATSALMTMLGYRAIVVGPPPSAGEHPEITSKKNPGVDLVEFFIGKAEFEIGVHRCASGTLVTPNDSCVEINTANINHVPLYAKIRRMFSGTGSSGTDGIIHKMLHRIDLSSQQVDFMKTYRFPLTKWLILAEKTSVSPQTVAAYASAVLTRQVVREVDTQVTYVNNYLSSISKPSSEGPSFEKERKDAYRNFRESMDMVYKSLNDDSKVHMEQIQKGIEEYQIMLEQRGR